MNTQKFYQLLNEHGVTNPFELGFYPHIGTRYALYRIEENEHILWCGADQYAKPAWLEGVWLPAHCLRSLDGVVETKTFNFRDKTWQLVEREIIWYEPTWLGRTPASEQELMRHARGSWQRSCITGNAVRFNKLRGKAARYALYYQQSMKNMLQRIENAGYVLEPVYGPRDGRPKSYLVYRSESARK